MPAEVRLEPIPDDAATQIASAQDFDVKFVSPVLERRVGAALGLATLDADNVLRLIRPLRASDMTRLVELDASNLGLSGSTVLDGLQYATNLEYLNLRGNAISNLSYIANGVHNGRANQGQLGLRSLRYLVLDGNPIVASTSQESTPQTRPALWPLGTLPKLEYVSAESLTTGTFDLAPFANLSQLRWLNVAGLNITDIYDTANPNAAVNDGLAPLRNLDHLQYLNAARNQFKDVRPLPNWTSCDG